MSQQKRSSVINAHLSFGVSVLHLASRSQYYVECMNFVVHPQRTATLAHQRGVILQNKNQTQREGIATIYDRWVTPLAHKGNNS